MSTNQGQIVLRLSIVSNMNEILLYKYTKNSSMNFSSCLPYFFPRHVDLFVR